MIKWLLYLVPAWIVSLICYLTNPIVVLFANEDGELPYPLNLWQTWDDSLDSHFYMTEVVPKWLDYDYERHYIHSTSTEPKYGRTRDISIATGFEWSIKELIQRYICRVLWLYRNNAYGFLYYWLGANPKDIRWVLIEDSLRYGKSEDIFSYKNDQKITDKIRWKIYIGWKTDPSGDIPHAMYAYRIWIKSL